jgi:predicted nucleic acid-binding protein
VDTLFLDANILFAAAYRGSAGLTCLWKLKDVDLVTSDYAYEEALRNLAEAAQHRRLNQLMKRVTKVAVRASSLPAEFPLAGKDRPILDAAIGAGATHLLTLDERHFGRLYGIVCGGVLIVHPREYMRVRQWTSD